MLLRSLLYNKLSSTYVVVSKSLIRLAIPVSIKAIHLPSILLSQILKYNLGFCQLVHYNVGLE